MSKRLLAYKAKRACKVLLSLVWLIVKELSINQHIRPLLCNLTVCRVNKIKNAPCNLSFQCSREMADCAHPEHTPIPVTILFDRLHQIPSWKGVCIKMCECLHCAQASVWQIEWSLCGDLAGHGYSSSLITLQCVSVCNSMPLIQLAAQRIRNSTILNESMLKLVLPKCVNICTCGNSKHLLKGLI